MRFLKALLYACFLISLVNCKDGKDDVAPLVSIVVPTENSSYNVLESVVIQANISDNKNVESVRISLISDVTKNQVVPSKTISVNRKEFFVEQVVEISDSLLETGRYYFRVEAFDGENYFSAFRYVFINGIIRKKLGVVVSCKNGAITDLYADKNDLNFQLLNSFLGNYEASVLNSSDQHFWFAPSNSELLSAYSFVDNSVVYSNRYRSNFSNPFSDIEIEDRDVLIGLRKGEIDGRNQNFSDSYTYLAQSGRRVESIAVNETYVLVEDLDNSGTNRKLNVLRRTSGTVKSSSVFNDDIIEIIFTEKDKCIVLANDSQGGRGVVFDISNGNILNTLFTTDSIRSAVKTNSGNIFLTTNSEVQFYVFQNGSSTTYLNKPNSIIKYDHIDGQLYVGSGNNLESYTYPRANPTVVSILPNEVVGINIRYNKN
ncbi:MAG: hypothetical protein JKY48_00265 [Flavobacteriales bacterium]|nr:hypothetical protein [Flavobacteriales bacterium]